MIPISRAPLIVLILFSLFMVSCAAVKTSPVSDGMQNNAQVTTPPAADPEAVSGQEPVSVQEPVLELEKEEEEFGEFEDEFAESDTEAVFDPLETYNRGMTRFNDGFFDWVVYPVAEGYNFIVPKGGRIAINRFFKNLFFPIRFVNNVLQLKYDKAATETGRFIVNTTVGLLGFFDPALSWFNLKPRPEDFGQTLGYYGVGSGFHIVLPFLGPSNLRDVIGKAPDLYATPLSYLEPVEAAYASEAYRRLNDASLRLGEYESLRKDALDLYTFLRDAYERNRLAQIKE